MKKQKKVLLIVGGLALIGTSIGIYYLVKNKEKKENKEGGQ